MRLSPQSLILENPPTRLRPFTPPVFSLTKEEKSISDFQSTEPKCSELSISGDPSTKSSAITTTTPSTTNPHSHPLKKLSSTATAPQNLNLTRSFCSSTSSSSLSSPLSSSSSYEAELQKYLGYSALLLGCGIVSYYSFPFPENAKHKKAQLFRYAPLPEDLHTVSNWSGTHEVQNRVFLQPETLQKLETFMRDANEKKQKMRPVGLGLSPNGIKLMRQGMVNLALMDKVLAVDKEKEKKTALSRSYKSKASRMVQEPA